MTGELGYTKQDGYDRWEIFKEQGIRRFGPTLEDVKALRELYQLKYKGDIDEFLQQIESKNNSRKSYGNSPQKNSRRQSPGRSYQTNVYATGVHRRQRMAGSTSQSG